MVQCGRSVKVKSRIRAVRGCCCCFPMTQRQATVSPKSGAEGCRQSSRHPVLISVLLRLQLVHCSLVNICGGDLQQESMCFQEDSYCRRRCLQL